MKPKDTNITRLGYSKKEASRETSLSIRMLDYYISNGVLKAHNYDSRAIINWEVVKTIYGAWTHSIIRARK